MVSCYLGIGSNLGDRRKNIRLALKKVNTLPNTKIVKVSKLRQTEPLGGPAGQLKFLNAVLRINTNLSVLTLLKRLKKIEKDLGRTKSVRYGPRTVDLDILLYGNRVINRKNLKVPHPKMFERKFVIKPLFEIL